MEGVDARTVAETSDLSMLCQAFFLHLLTHIGQSELKTFRRAGRQGLPNFPTQFDIVHISGAKCCFARRICAPSAYTAQLLTLM